MKLSAITSINWRRVSYHVRHNYLTLNNAVIAIAMLIAISWAWGSVMMMQRNYELQRKVDAKNRELTLTELEVQTLQFQKRYFQSDEYQELSAREYLGLAASGEKLLILPPNSKKARAADDETNPSVVRAVQRSTPPSNMQQWLDFLSGDNVR